MFIVGVITLSLPMVGPLVDLGVTQRITRRELAEARQDQLEELKSANMVFLRCDTVALTVTVATMCFGLLGTTLGGIAIGWSVVALLGRAWLWNSIATKVLQEESAD